MIELSFPQKFMPSAKRPSLNFFARMDDIPDETFEGALIIVCDTANTGRISDQRYLKGKRSSNRPPPERRRIRRHQLGRYSASSTSELIYELYLSNQAIWKSMRRLQGSFMAASWETRDALFQARPTKHFNMPRNWLNIRLTGKASRWFVVEVDPKIAKLRGYVLQNLSITPSGMTAIKLTKDIRTIWSQSDETSSCWNVRWYKRFEGVGIFHWRAWCGPRSLAFQRANHQRTGIKIQWRWSSDGCWASVYSWEEADELISELMRYAADNKLIVLFLKFYIKVQHNLFIVFILLFIGNEPAAPSVFSNFTTSFSFSMPRLMRRINSPLSAYTERPSFNWRIFSSRISLKSNTVI